MLILIISLTFVVFSNAESYRRFSHPLSDEFIDYINTVQSSWLAGRNFQPNISMEYIKKLPGAIKRYPQLPVNRNLEENDDVGLPDNFDARQKWPYCKSLNEIWDQGACSGSWAIAPATTTTDHVCTQSGGKKEFHVSAIDIITCQPYDKSFDCNGDMMYSGVAWDYLEHNGAVSGGNYNSSKGCKPYLYRNCNHYQIANNGYPNCTDVHEIYDKCVKKCISNDTDYLDKLKVKSMPAQNMRKTIFNYGPVQVQFDVYTDFISYKKGVYKHTAGELIRSHAVKIIGWGVENGVKYWLAANTWNEYWGDKGFFKIARGINHCNIENLGYYPIFENLNQLNI